MKRITVTKIHSYLLLVILIALFLNSHATSQTSTTVLTESYVEYEAKDERETILGTAPIKTLDLTFNPENIQQTRLTLTLEPAKFDSRNAIRDTNARRTVFETSDYPEIVFTLSNASGSTNSLVTGESAQLELAGDLTMHGVTKSITVPTTVSLTDSILSAEGNFEVLLSDFDMSRPSFLVWTIEDTVLIRFVIAAQVN